MTKPRKTKEHFKPEKYFSNLENEQFCSLPAPLIAALFYLHPLLNPFDFIQWGDNTGGKMEEDKKEKEKGMKEKKKEKLK